MPIRDLKSKIEKLEHLLEVNQDTPAPWALDSVRFSMEILTPRPHTEEDIYRQALELTQRFGTKENYDKACIESYRNFDIVGFRVRFMNPTGFRKRTGQCDICETVLTDGGADFCQTCHEKYPETIREIEEYRKKQKG